MAGCRWFYNSKLFWSDCTGLPCEASVSLGERLAYCLTLGFYVQVRAAGAGALGLGLGGHFLLYQ